MTIPVSKKNVHSLMVMTLAMVSMIAPADAQTVSCDSTSPQCCWVVASWMKMGRTTSVNPNVPKACCYYFSGQTPQTSGIPGVTCSRHGIATKIVWNAESLTGEIPPEMGNLQTLVLLELSWNQLNGSIPREIGNLVNLMRLALEGNHLTGDIPAEIGNLVNLNILDLANNKLNGSIPTKMGELVNADYIRISQNQLSGIIPSQIGNLRGLQRLILNGNRQLDGTYTPQCYTTSGGIPAVAISGTGVSICGCLASSTPPSLFPPPGTSDKCLATSPALALEKRTVAFSHVIGGYKYTCNVDANMNPFADCLNSMAKICDPAGTSFNKITCQNGVDQMFRKMSTHWQRVRRECGQWSWTQNYQTYTGNSASTHCAFANSNLIANAFYIENGVRVRVASGLTDSINERLWRRVT